MVTYKFHMAVIEKILAVFSNSKVSNSAGLALTCSVRRELLFCFLKSPLWSSNSESNSTLKVIRKISWFQFKIPNNSKKLIWCHALLPVDLKLFLLIDLLVRFFLSFYARANWYISASKNWIVYFRDFFKNFPILN